MRVLVVTNLYPNPGQPNLATFNRSQFSALSKEHQVQIIAPIAWTTEWKGRSRRGPKPWTVSGRPMITDGMVIHHPRYVYTPRVLRGWYGRFLTESIRRCFDETVRTFRPDVVLGSWAYPDGWAAVKLARRAGIPVAIKVLGSDLATFGQTIHACPRERRTIEALKAADAVITVSRHLRDKAVALGTLPERTRLVYNGVDHGAFSTGPRHAARTRIGLSGERPMILFVGNLVPVKGLDVLVHALARLRRLGVEFDCRCIGEGPLLSSLQTLAAKQGIADRMLFIGPRPQAELPDWYRAAHVVVLPSRSEGVPNVLLEAAACGTPYVASSVGGVPEIAPPGSMVPPNDPDALAERLGAMLKGGALVTAVGTPSCTWEDSARGIADVLKGIVQDHNSRLAQTG
jgi:glycosyltransferase involved in cell wall biosynthesis